MVKNGMLVIIIVLSLSLIILGSAYTKINGEQEKVILELEFKISNLINQLDAVKRQEKIVVKLDDGTKSPLIVEGAYNITVTTDLESLIKAGKYDYISPNINPKNFNMKDTVFGDKTVFIVKIFEQMSSEGVVKEMEGKWLRPANLMELCAFGARYPDLQKEYPIVALDSSASLYDYRYVPGLWRASSDGRSLDLCGCSRGWSSYYRFLAVRK